MQLSLVLYSKVLYSATGEKLQNLLPRSRPAPLPPACRMDYSLTRYQASAILSLKFNLPAIRARIAEAKGSGLAEAA